MDGVPYPQPHALCKPQRGDHRGCDRRVGRATTGATRQAPPHLQRDKCRASCLHRARDVLTPEDRLRGSPPPPPQRGDSEGTWGGGRGQTDTPRGETSGERWRKKKTKETNAPQQGQTAGADGTRQEPGSTARGVGKGDTPGEGSWEAGTNTAANGGGLGWQEPAKDAGEVPDLRGLGAPPMSVSAPPERRQ